MTTDDPRTALVGKTVELVGGKLDGVRLPIHSVDCLSRDWRLTVDVQSRFQTAPDPLFWNARYQPDLIPGAGSDIKQTEDGRAYRFLLEKE